MWFDCKIENPGSSKELELNEFPGTVFLWTPSKLTATDENGNILLIPPMFTQMIWNIYLADLNGDGLPEFCATINVGSGFIDERIYVYDYAAKKSYELSDRFHHNYSLSLKEGKLLATQKDTRGQVITTGKLAIVDEELLILPEIKPFQPRMWFNRRIGNPGNSLDLVLDEFPSTVFRWTQVPNKFTATDADGEKELSYGWPGPISSIYLADLNGDGLPEFCTIVSVGSGMVSGHIFVYDYAAKKVYELSDRPLSYSLSIKGGKLFATKKDIYGSVIVAGNLAIVDDELVLIDSAPQSPGVSVCGLVKSYYPKHETTLQLFRNGAGPAETTAAYTATVSAASGSGQAEQNFGFSGVEPGIYTLVISKPAHADFTVHNIVVGDNDVDLTQDPRPEVQSMTMRCGDINGDGNINNSDLTMLWSQANYNRSAADALNPECDLNGDGLINNIDLTILWLAYNYNRGAVIIP
jgi:hypothetical protein